MPLHSSENMICIDVRYDLNDTMPKLLVKRAEELDITVEQLVKRFISSCMREEFGQACPAIPGETLQDFLEKNGVITADDKKSNL